ncbi:MAG: TIGR03808 family TAT-translocated repetitive protein [Hyphomicrobiaceae bacterium]|nr:TIGR03808 family TAT-translocated repetitive protein [Hyphomicrobiaceae bacterium]MCC0023139.1 TIGR03808 family TAT-translocated repetitive protein [Hyphomicrobiaceae bacterium]
MSRPIPIDNPKIARRHFLAAASAAVIVVPKGALALDGASLGVVGDTGRDVTAQLEDAIRQAAGRGASLQLDAGDYLVSDLKLPTGARIAGNGARLILSGGDMLLSAEDQRDIQLSDLSFDGKGQGRRGTETTLVGFRNCENVVIENCGFADFESNGLYAETSSINVTDCLFSGFGETGLHLQDCRLSQLRGNRVLKSGNGAIRVWRFEKGFDGTIVTNNQISGVGSDSGNGQNGNGINVFQADGVVVSNNVIQDCDFSAIRANTTRDTIISNNQCHDCREVAIFSEFAFTGSVIANNVIDKAATGISITNLDDEGHLATCTGNVVRNILPSSPTNPDTYPVGIYVEAEIAVTGNVVEDVPGLCIGAGWGPYLRNVLIANNVLRRGQVGVGVSVVDGSGAVQITNNLIADMSQSGIAGFEWDKMVAPDLKSGDYAHVTLGGNTFSG